MSIRFSSKKYVDKPVKIRGRTWLEFTPADVGNISRYVWYVNPTQFGTTKVLDDLAHNFVWFRYTKLRCVHMEYGANNGPHAVGYLPYPSTNLPTTLEEIVEAGESMVYFNGQTVPSEMSLGRSELNQQAPKWFRVEPFDDDALEYQGVLIYGDEAEAVTTEHMILEYEIEFLALADDPLTPSPRSRPGKPHDPPTMRVPTYVRNPEQAERHRVALKRRLQQKPEEKSVGGTEREKTIQERDGSVTVASPRLSQFGGPPSVSRPEEGDRSFRKSGSARRSQ